MARGNELAPQTHKQTKREPDSRRWVILGFIRKQTLGLMACLVAWCSSIRRVTFSGEPLGSTREDDSRVRDRTATRNLALLRKIALNIVGRDQTTKASVRARRERAAWNEAYMLKLLAGQLISPVQYRHEISCIAPGLAPGSSLRRRSGHCRRNPHGRC